MKIGLASIAFETANLDLNKNRIIKVIEELAPEVDMIFLGEAYLHGFNALSWDYEKDKDIALSLDSPIISEISQAAKNNQCGLSFGFYENFDSKIYSSQITLDKDGQIIDVFRRISPGWKTSEADDNYLEGSEFKTFDFLDYKFAVGICGDLWFSENVEKISNLDADIVLWPVYTDFKPDIWNKAYKYDYAIQAKEICDKVLLVNSVCFESDNPVLAKGGACYFYKGKILGQVPAGSEKYLLVEL